MVISVREYLDERGSSPFARWFEGLDAIAAQRLLQPFIVWSRATFQGLKASRAVSMNAKSILAQVIGSTLAKRAKKSLSCLAEVRRSVRESTSRTLCPVGKITSDGNAKR